MELITISNKSDSSGLIRIKAAKFFLTRFNPNILTYLFGNGHPGPWSYYSQYVSLYAIRDGYNISDIGIIGDYIEYGIIFVIGGIMMILKGAFFKVSQGFYYLKYYIFIQCFTLLTGNGIFGGVDIIILMILYIFDVNRHELIKEKQMITIESKE